MFNSNIHFPKLVSNFEHFCILALDTIIVHAISSSLPKQSKHLTVEIYFIPFHLNISNKISTLFFSFHSTFIFFSIVFFAGCDCGFSLSSKQCVWRRLDQ
eukprot:123867_1